MLLITLTVNLAISVNNTTIINNYIEKSEKNFQEQKADILAINETTTKVQENVTKIKAEQVKELAIQEEILSEVD